MDDLPVQPGTYTLFLRLVETQLIEVGKLGQNRLSAGLYAYQGSAKGPGGLRARLGRHLRGNGKPNWHIDYLREISEVLGFAYIEDQENQYLNIPVECAWSQFLVGGMVASVPIPGFGASDCNSGCLAHLANISEKLSLEDHLWESLCKILSATIIEVKKSENDP